MDQAASSKSRKPSPKDTASFFSIFTLFYTLKIFIKGFKRELEAEDLYAVMKKLKSKELGNRLEKYWLKYATKKKKLTLLRVIWFCFGKRFILYGSMDLITSTYLNVVMPRATGRLVEHFSAGEATVPLFEAYFYAALFIFSILIDIFLYNNYALLMLELATSMRAAFCSMLYRKCLKLGPAAQSEYTTGRLVSLMTKDVQVMDTFIVNGCNAWIGVMHIFIITTLVYLKIGFAAFVGVGIFLLALPIEIYISHRVGLLRKESSKKTDIRLEHTQEAVSAIKIIKMYAWENFFVSKIGTTRKEEILKLRRLNYLRALIICLSFLASQVSFYALLMTFIKYGSNVTPENIYYTISIYGDLKFFIGKAVPFGILYLEELRMSASRIEHLMDAEELSPTSISKRSDSVTKVIMRNVTSKIRDKVVLANISCDFPKGLSVVTGPLGGGKSSLLKLILQEYPANEGQLEVHGSLSYASQEPWIFPATIKQNILFGQAYDDMRYQKVVEVCALNYDFALLANGDDTIADDRGMNLSKGQQARINLARAIYRKTDIYLLDDCLASLDSRVQGYIFKECILTFLKNKTCIWVTHSTGAFKEAVQVVLLESGAAITITDCNNIPVNTIYKDEDGPEIVKNVTANVDDYKEECTELSQLIKIEESREKDVYHEVKRVGSVVFDVYKQFLKFGGGVLPALLILTLYLGDQFSVSYLDKIMSSWVNTMSEIIMFRANNDTNSTTHAEMLSESLLDRYFIMLVVTHFSVILKTTFFIYYISRISINIHKETIARVINASMTFFDNTFIGNILNRFSRDVTIIDEELPLVINECLRAICEVLGTFGLIASVNPIYLISACIAFVLLITVRQIYIVTGRSLKRLDSATRSPMIGHLHATIEGLTTIRAYGMQETVKEEFDRHQDLYTSAFHMSCITQKGFAVALHMISLFHISFTMAHLVFFSGARAGDAGLILTQASNLAHILQCNIFQWALLENHMTSVERLLEYTTIKQEPTAGLQPDKWPTNGSIVYKDVSLTYQKTDEQVLRNVNIFVAPRGKIGIVGRTGAGKSSIISTLFRLYDIEGNITIDDVDTSKVAVRFLRSAMSIIPQDPILFRGSIRDNIDPFGLQSEDQIWKVIDAVKLSEKISDLHLKIEDVGPQFSAGQKQLICLARALVKQNKIIVLDEATANMDPETDALIANIIREQFRECTVITVAHKLDSIMNSDRVVVMDKGEVVEFDSPTVLSRKKDSFFHSMMAAES